MDEFKLNTLIINQLTKEQYESITPQENQLYLVEEDKTVDEIVSDAIQEHNESNSAHSDIRNLITETKNVLSGQITNMGDNLSILIEGKQDTLIAGDNINITNNVISADKGATVIVKDWRI